MAEPTTPALEPNRRSSRAHRRSTPSIGVVVAGGWLLLVTFLAVFAPWIGIADPLAQTAMEVRAAPNLEHWFGTDGLGRDLFARTVYGGRTSLWVGFAGSVCGALVGTALGTIAGFLGGRTDQAIMTAMDMMLAFPALVLALTLAALMGPGVVTVTIAIVVLSIPVFARAVRSHTLTLANSEFVLAARCMGMSSSRILAREILPNVMPIVIAYGLVVMAVAIVVEGSLSFLGVGVPPPAPLVGQPDCGRTQRSGSGSSPEHAPRDDDVPDDHGRERARSDVRRAGCGSRLLGGGSMTDGALHDAASTGDATPSPVLEVRDLSVWLGGGQRTIRAVDDVSLSLGGGEVLGVVGESGAGKSVLARTLMGLTGLDGAARVEGQVEVTGVPILSASEKELRSLWGRRMAIVFQDPLRSLNPVVRVERQLTEILKLTGLDRSERSARATELLDEVGIVEPERCLRLYPSQLSGGMRQRVAIAIALAGEPDLVVADEPTTALDVTTANRIMALFRELQRSHRMSLVVISHDFRVVTGIADKVAVMYAGRVAELGPTESVTEDPRMPYSRALLDCVPSIGSDRGARLPAIPGRPPDPSLQRSGCAFEPRCAHASERCDTQPASVSPLGEPERSYECWHPLGGRPIDGGGVGDGR
jgi:peptide/nickel transport system permease protein